MCVVAVALMGAAVVMAAPQKGGAKEEPIPILSQSSNIEVDGSYQYR